MTVARLASVSGLTASAQTQPPPPCWHGRCSPRAHWATTRSGLERQADWGPENGSSYPSGYYNFLLPRHFGRPFRGTYLHLSAHSERSIHAILPQTSSSSSFQSCFFQSLNLQPNHFYHNQSVHGFQPLAIPPSSRLLTRILPIITNPRRGLKHTPSLWCWSQHETQHRCSAGWSSTLLSFIYIEKK